MTCGVDVARLFVAVYRYVLIQLQWTRFNLAYPKMEGNYTTYFFQIAGVKDPFLGNLILTLISFVFVVLSLFTIDRFGRRGMCLWALVILGIINIIIGALSWIKASNSAGGGALVAMCALFKAVFSFTLNPAGECTPYLD